MIPPPRRRRMMTAVLAALCLTSAVGCARTGSFLAWNPKRGSLRENLSRVEFQNQRLKDDLKVAQEDARRMANDLQLAEIDNRDLARRLESFRTQLGLNGSAGDSYDLARPDYGASSPDPRATRPAAQPPSRAPFTRIPNPAAIDVTPPPGPPAEDSFGTRRPSSFQERPRPYIDPPPVQYFDLSQSSGRSDDRLGSTGAGSTWSPLARGSSGSNRDYR